MEKIKELDRLLSDMGIEYHAILAYSDVRETAPHIMKKSGLTPRSVLVFLLPYYGGEAVNLSRYAASLDYHIIIKEVTDKICKWLNENFQGSHSCGFGDRSPIDERHCALTAGLGILGDNGLLINEKYGSYIFIADVITDIPPELLGAQPKGEIKKCRHCGKCRAACPTGILRGESNDCLSAITQRKGELTEAECALMREYNTAWGCDICQGVCPHNTAPIETPISFFKENRIDTLTSSILDAMSDEDFSRRAFAWRGKSTVRRNTQILEKK